MAKRTGSHRLQGGDALILMAVWSRDGAPRSLESIIASADYLNHAVPLRESLEDAFTRLNAAGLLRRRKAGYVPTERTMETMERVLEHSGLGTREQLQNLASMLDCPCCGVRFGKPRRRLEVAVDAYEESVRDYQARHA